jgi:putative phosphoribosyl transferase
VLAEQLRALVGPPDALILGVVRGGVPVAAVIAERLRVPLDVLVVRKLGVPWAPELAFGAVGAGGISVINPEIAANLSAEDIAAVVARETTELHRREALYRGTAWRPAAGSATHPDAHSPGPYPPQTVVVVDDGWATGATARTAVAMARALGARRVIAAAPVASTEAVAAVGAVADEVVCPRVPPDFFAVGHHYDSFPQVSDEEVSALLAAARSSWRGHVDEA